MPRIEIICVGNELLIGKILNTNAQWLSEEIHKFGGFVARHTVVGDDVECIAEAVKEALKRRTNLLIISGGLGPTYDDKTLEGLSKALRRRLEVNQEALTQIEAKYRKMVEQGILEKFELTPPRVKMATLPAKSIPLRNPIGTAPAVMIEYKGSKIFCLPGVPSELKAIFVESVSPHIKQLLGDLFAAESSLEVRGLPESSLAPFLDKVVAKHKNIYVKSHPKGFEGSEPKLELYISTSQNSDLKAKSLVEEVISELTQYIVEAGGKGE
ncbi:MAG: molybdopterin-binding protein, partial [Nitrososphaerales archaeon]